MQTIKQKWNSRHEDESGFTLIELLVVIVIIGVLSAVVVFSVAGISDRGNDSACKADKKTVTVAQEANFAQKGAYASEADLVTNGFLESQSKLYNTAASGTPAGSDFTITVEGTKCTGI